MGVAELIEVVEALPGGGARSGELESPRLPLRSTFPDSRVAKLTGPLFYFPWTRSSALYRTSYSK